MLTRTWLLYNAITYPPKRSKFWWLEHNRTILVTVLFFAHSAMNVKATRACAPLLFLFGYCAQNHTAQHHCSLAIRLLRRLKTSVYNRVRFTTGHCEKKLIYSSSLNVWWFYFSWHNRTVGETSRAVLALASFGVRVSEHFCHTKNANALQGPWIIPHMINRGCIYNMICGSQATTALCYDDRSHREDRTEEYALQTRLLEIPFSVELSIFARGREARAMHVREPNKGTTELDIAQEAQRLRVTLVMWRQTISARTKPNCICNT